MEPSQEEAPPTRVLRLFSRLNVGGPSIHVILLTAGLAAKGYKTRLVIGTEAPHEGNLLDVAAEKGVACEAMASLGREIRPFADFARSSALYRLMRAYRPQIVHTHAAKAGLLGRLAARLAGVPVVVHTYHGHVLRGYFGAARQRSSCCLETLPRPHQRRAGRGLAAREAGPGGAGGGAARDDSASCPWASSSTRWPEPCRAGASRHGGIPDDAPLIGMVGRLVPIKDVPTFLRAAARVRQVTPQARFALVGDGEERRIAGGAVRPSGPGRSRDVPRLAA